MNKQGEFIKNARRKQGLTQKQLADKLNVSDKVISKWEIGDSFPDYTLLPELAKLLNVEINEILNGEFQQKTEPQRPKIIPAVHNNNIYIVNSGENKQDSTSNTINLQDNKLNNMVLKCKKCDTDDITILSNDIFQCNKCKTRYRVKNNPVINNTSNVVNNYNIENKVENNSKTFKDKIINILLFIRNYQNYFFLGFYLLSFILLFTPVIKWNLPSGGFSDNFFKFLFIPFQQDKTKYLLGDYVSAMFTLAKKDINIISWIMSIVAWIYVITLIIIVTKVILNIVKKEKYDNNKAFKHSIIISVLCVVSFIIAKVIISQINGMFADSGMDTSAFKNNGMPIKTTLIWSILWSFISVTFSSLFKYLKCLNKSINNSSLKNGSEEKKSFNLSEETKRKIKSITKKCVIVLVVLGVLIGGGFGIFAIVKKTTSSPQNTWNDFVNCINNSRYSDTMKYIYYLSDDQKDNYESYSTSYALYSNLSTSSFRQIEADGNYAIYEIVLNTTMIVSGTQTNPVYKYNVYFVKDLENEWKLLSPLNITLGNNNNYQIDNSNKLIYSNLYENKTAIFYYGDSFESMRLPNDIDSISGTFYAHLTSLNTSNVRNCPTNLKSLTIPNTIKTIENRAFSNFTSITQLYLPKNLSSIGDYAFYNSNSLVNLYYDGDGLTLGNKSLPDSLIFSISYDLGGGVNNSDNPYTYTANTPTFTLKEPTKSGYTFVGWTTKTQTTPIKQYSIKIKSIGNKTMIANWEESLYSSGLSAITTSWNMFKSSKSYTINGKYNIKMNVPLYSTIGNYNIIGDIQGAKWEDGYMLESIKGFQKEGDPQYFNLSRGKERYYYNNQQYERETTNILYNNDEIIANYISNFQESQNVNNMDLISYVIDEKTITNILTFNKVNDMYEVKVTLDSIESVKGHGELIKDFYNLSNIPEFKSITFQCCIDGNGYLRELTFIENFNVFIGNGGISADISCTIKYEVSGYNVVPTIDKMFAE